MSLFTVGVLGFAFNRKNLIIRIISLEIILLAVSVLAIECSVSIQDLHGQNFAIYVVSVAGIESAIGLSLLVSYYRLRGTITL